MSGKKVRPTRFISPELTEVFTDMVGNGMKLNPLLLDKLEEDDRSFLAEVCHQCECPEVIAGFGLKQKRDEEYDRFRLLQGSIIAGDNSLEVLKELRSLVMRFIADGRMDMRSGVSVLADIAVLL